MSREAKLAAVIGWPIAHSKSPAMLNAAFAATNIDAEMIAMGAPPEQFAATVQGLRELPMLGASITLPHKLAAHALCDELSPAARAIGAVNCLALERGRLIGHNTDASGFGDAARGANLELAGSRVVLLGAGGAARAVAYAAAEAGAHVDVIARSPCAWFAAQPWSELATTIARADLLVDCTPTGLDEASDAAFAAQIPLDALPKSAGVATLVYHRATALLERARALGHATLDGRAMLVHQAGRAFAIWTGRTAPVDIIARALDESLKTS
jgi:shikimate dehydrogenase